MNRQFLQSQIAGIESQRYKLEWLASCLTHAEKIANFGCDLGSETLALMWLFQAHEAIGLDIDAEDVDQARDTLHGLQVEIAQARRAVDYPWVSQNDRIWWSVAPTFFTQRIVADDFMLEYQVRDITRPTGLKDDHYGLAFCDFVLHHIWYDESRENAEQDVQLAVNEMARVVKPGGIVAAREPIHFDDKPQLDFARLFDNAGLEELLVEEEEFEDLERWEGKYVYRKSASSAGNGI